MAGVKCEYMHRGGERPCPLQRCVGISIKESTVCTDTGAERRCPLPELGGTLHSRERIVSTVREVGETLSAPGDMLDCPSGREL